MVKVLAMMKMPTKSEMAAKTSSIVFMLLVPLAISLACSSFSSWPVSVLNWSSAGTFGFTWASSALSSVPGLACTAMLLYWPGASSSCCAVARSKRVSVPPEETPGSSVVKTPVRVASTTGPFEATRTVSPTL